MNEFTLEYAGCVVTASSTGEAEVSEDAVASLPTTPT
jgi:hypothetical protein